MLLFGVMLYYLCGLGTDERLWQPLITQGLPGKVLKYPAPLPDDTLPVYAGRWSAHLAEEMAGDQDAVLVGMSFGGLMAGELARLLNPKGLVLISTLKRADELPPYFRRMRVLTDYVTGMQLRDWHFNLARLYYGILPDSAANDLIVKMIGDSDPTVHRFIIRSVLHWAPSWQPFVNLLHVHGALDRVFPPKYLKEPVSYIPGGTHIVVLEEPALIAAHIQKYLVGLGIQLDTGMRLVA